MAIETLVRVRLLTAASLRLAVASAVTMIAGARLLLDASPFVSVRLVRTRLRSAVREAMREIRREHLALGLASANRDVRAFGCDLGRAPEEIGSSSHQDSSASDR